MPSSDCLLVGSLTCAHNFASPPSRAPRSTCRYKSTTTKSRRPISFAFDIDGVLLKSSEPIPGAREALELLKQHDIPFILLTNGGGLSEASRVANLSRHLGTAIKTSQFIQSHTPFQLHAASRRHGQHGQHGHGYRNVLVCGGKLDACRHVALDYGFPHVTIPFDILATDPACWPYHVLSREELSVTRPLHSRNPIDAIYVFHDPLDWGLDSQIILDTLLMCRHEDGERGGDGGKRTREQQVPIYFSNPDLLWANAYAHPRFGQGAFQILIEGLFTAVTGKTLKSTTIGKPSRVTYEYADVVLRKLQASIYGTQTDAAAAAASSDEGIVYMVGDNKLSDIQGANHFGWQSILVKTGVFDGTSEEGLSGSVPAKYCVEDVGEAVNLVLKSEGVI